MRDIATRVIPLAKIISQKGIPQKNIFKAEVYSGSARIFKDLKQIYYRGELSKDFVEVTLADSMSPLGAKWEDARFLKVTFPEAFPVEISGQIALLRSAFPLLNEGEEAYLCDLLDMDVYDEQEAYCGKVSSFSWQGPVACESVLIEVEKDESRVQVPWTDQMTIDRENFKLHYPGFSLWEKV